MQNTYTYTRYIALKENGNTEQYYYTETDHLGSILALYDENGNKVYEQSFDAWGRERNPITWDYSTSPYTKPAWLIRGFTGHEMLPEFSLINMNGRMYDPILGRMLSPDNYVQDATGTQGYNRYSYAFNNPLKYTDPDGEIVIIPALMIGFFAGAVISGYAGGTPGQIMMGAFVGAAASGAGAGVGGVVAGASFTGATAVGTIAGGATSGAISGAGNAAIFGGNANQIGTAAWQGAVTGGAGAFVGGAVGGAGGAFLGGATASGVGTALYGGSTEQIIQRALVGGAIGLATYEASTYANYKMNYKGNLNYGGYRKVSAAIARSNFWEGEAIWYEMPDGSVAKMKFRPFSSGIDPKTAPEGALYEAHTHPRAGRGFPFAGPTDIANYQRTSGTYDFKVYGAENVYTVNRSTVSQIDVSGLGYWDSSGFNPTISPSSYYNNYAIPYGLNVGVPHGFSLYYHNVYRFGR